MRLTHGLVSALLALGSWAMAPSVEAQPAPDEQAQVHFQAGTSYFQVADYEAALREFERAFELSGRPALMYNLYLSHERLGHLADAAAWLQRYLDEAPEVYERESLTRRLETMQRRLAESAPLEPTPEAEALSEGSAPLEPRPPEPGPPPAAGYRLPDGATAAFVGAGISLTSFIVFGSLALEEDAVLAQECEGMCEPGQIQLLEAFLITADVSLAVAGAMAIAGLIWALVGADSGEPAATAPLALWVTSEGVGGLVQRSF